jgi:hypothetical protein
VIQDEITGKRDLTDWDYAGSSQRDGEERCDGIPTSISRRNFLGKTFMPLLTASITPMWRQVLQVLAR